VRLLAWLGCSLVPALASAADGDTALPVKPAEHAPIIGGTDVADGKWPDVAAIMFPSPRGPVALCTGTLVAPTIVLTAAHCYDPFDPPLPVSVLIGTTSLALPDRGENIPILRGSTFPDIDGTHDIAVLVLARPSTLTPRKIATG
jgi:secreted trypsin-like serine protease